MPPYAAKAGSAIYLVDQFTNGLYSQKSGFYENYFWLTCLYLTTTLFHSRRVTIAVVAYVKFYPGKMAIYWVWSFVNQNGGLQKWEWDMLEVDYAAINRSLAVAHYVHHNTLDQFTLIVI